MSSAAASREGWDSITRAGGSCRPPLQALPNPPQQVGGEATKHGWARGPVCWLSEGLLPWQAVGDVSTWAVICDCCVECIALANVWAPHPAGKDINCV